MAKQHKQPDSAPNPTGDENRPGRLAALRAYISARLPKLSRRTVIGLTIGLVLLIVNGAALLIWLPKVLNSQAQAQVRNTLPQALAALDHRSFNEAQYLAALMQKSPQLDSADRGGPAFVIGAALAEQAESLPESQRTAAYQSAARYLEEARSRGFPTGRQAQGLFLLGKSLYTLGDYIASRTALEEAVHGDQQPDSEICLMLADSYFRGAEPDDRKAEQYIQKGLNAPSLTPSQRDAALLLDARILDRMGDTAGCDKALSQISESAVHYSAALEFEARRLMRQAGTLAPESKGEVYQQAIEKLRLAQSRSAADLALALRCMYFIGVCQQEAGQTETALAQFNLVRNESPHSDEGVAATFRIAELLRRQGQEEKAIAAYRQLVQAMGDVTTYHNEYLSLDDVRRQLLANYEQYLRTAQFDPASQMAKLLHPLFPRERDLELQGELLRAAAKSYLAKAEGAPADQAKILAAKARASLRQAGQAFSKLAELHTASRSYTDDLWNAAECFMQGHDYRHTTTTLELYLKNEVRRRRATALMLLGEAQLALGQTDKGMSALNECISTYATDPSSYRARLLLAKADQQQGDDAKAEALLRSNLEEGSLTPRSVEWRDSLFALASLMQMAGRYAEAIPRLEEAVARYPDAAQSIEARYLVAESYRRLAVEARKKLATDTTETARAADAKQMHDNLMAAVGQFEQLQSILTRDRPNDSNPLDKAILRNCYFSRGAALYDLGRYEDAIRVYLTAANTYRNQPEMLEALAQVAACYRHLNRPDEARGTIVQAKAALAQIDKKANFTLTTNYTRDEWGQVLDQMATL